MRVTILIPVCNEAATIATVLERVSKLECEKQIVVVDDGSTDGTSAIVDRWSDRDGVVVIHKTNGGKGSALQAALPVLDSDVTVIQDADLEYDPEDISGMLEPLARGVADVVYGSRFSGGRPQRVHRFFHYLGNRVLTLTANVLYDTSLTDIGTGYKAIRTQLLRELDLRETGFPVDAEFTARVCRRRLSIYEVPIAYYGRTYAEGKKIHWRHGFQALWVLWRCRIFG
jgi:glycosyltransferase involved in cell wall biosynthesis